MDRGLVTVIGMSIAYVASFLGLGLAWWSWRRRQREGDHGDATHPTVGRPGDDTGVPDRGNRP